MADLPVFEAVEPIAICGVCGVYIYPNSYCPNARPYCPLLGDRWRNYQAARAMMNAYPSPSIKNGSP